MNKLFYTLIGIQLLLIICILNIIYKKVGNNLGKTSINLINKEFLTTSSSSYLKFFYEPRANVVEQLHKDWLPYVPRYTINADALNERFNYPIKNNGLTYRIITLGDSFTFGQNVSTDKNWTELLENQLNDKLSCKNIQKYEVINLGVGGYDFEYEVERFRLRGIKYDPDLVIWTFTDFERILEKEMPYILEHKEEATTLEKQGIYYKNWADARESLEKEIGKKGFNNHLKEKLDQFYNLYKKRLLLVTLPNNKMYIDTLKNFTSKRVNTYFFESSIKWNQTEYFLPDLHFNDLGHKKMTEDIFNYLTENKIIPCD